MSKKQLQQSHILRNYNEKKIDRRTAAKTLGLSERQVARLAKGMREEGESALIHKNTEKKPTHAIQPETKTLIIDIYQQDTYAGCNINHFKELLEREHGIRISYSALYGLLKDGGITSPKRHSRTKTHRRRKRKASAGEMLQIDASPYDWLGTGNPIALHGSIDDATGQITGLYMTENECLHGYFEVMRQTCLNFGTPLSVYSDKHTIFRSPATDKHETAGSVANHTQFGRALDELGVSIIYAHSPQAKGRVERVWGTLQSRLPVELRLNGIETVEAANTYIADVYIPMFNERFSVTAESSSIFVPYTYKDDIDNILCIKEQRKTDNAGSFSFHGNLFKVVDGGYPLIPVKTQIEVFVGFRNSLRVQYKGRVFETEIYNKPPAAHSSAKRKPKPPANIEARVQPHLKHGGEDWKRIWHYEDYDESLAFIFELFLDKYA